MKNIKGTIALFLTVALLVVCVPVNTFAAETPSEDNVIMAEIQPRIGYAFHDKFPLTVPSLTYNFTPTKILFPYQEWSFKASGFKLHHIITAYLYDNNFNQIADPISSRGDIELKNMRLTTNFVPSERYLLYITVNDSWGNQSQDVDGTIEFWVF